MVLAAAGSTLAFQQSAPQPVTLRLAESRIDDMSVDDDAVALFLSRRAVVGGAISLAATTLLGRTAMAAPAVLERPQTNQKTLIGEGKPFALNVKLSVLPEKRKAWLEQIRDNQKFTRKDEALQFSISEDVKTPSTFYLHQQYANEAAYRAHLDSPHARRYNEFLEVEKPFAAEPVSYFFSPLEEGPDWAVKKKRSVPKTAYCVTVNLYPKPAVREDFLDVIRANKKGTDTTEALALQYTFGESASQPGTFHFHEEYRGKEDGKQGFDAHAGSPHFAGWMKFVDTDPFVKPPEVYFSKIIEG